MATAECLHPLQPAQLSRQAKSHQPTSVPVLNSSGEAQRDKPNMQRSQQVGQQRQRSRSQTSKKHTQSASEVPAAPAELPVSRRRPHAEHYQNRTGGRPSQKGFTGSNRFNKPHAAHKQSSMQQHQHHQSRRASDHKPEKILSPAKKAETNNSKLSRKEHKDKVPSSVAMVNKPMKPLREFSSLDSGRGDELVSSDCATAEGDDIQMCSFAKCEVEMEDDVFQDARSTISDNSSLPSSAFMTPLISRSPSPLTVPCTDTPTIPTDKLTDKLMELVQQQTSLDTATEKEARAGTHCSLVHQTSSDSGVDETALGKIGDISGTTSNGGKRRKKRRKARKQPQGSNNGHLPSKVSADSAIGAEDSVYQPMERLMTPQSSQAITNHSPQSSCSLSPQSSFSVLYSDPSPPLSSSPSPSPREPVPPIEQLLLQLKPRTVQEEKEEDDEDGKDPWPELVAPISSHREETLLHSPTPPQTAPLLSAPSIEIFAEPTPSLDDTLPTSVAPPLRSSSPEAGSIPLSFPEVVPIISTSPEAILSELPASKAVSPNLIVPTSPSVDQPLSMSPFPDTNTPTTVAADEAAPLLTDTPSLCTSTPIFPSTEDTWQEEESLPVVTRAPHPSLQHSASLPVLPITSPSDQLLCSPLETRTDLPVLLSDIPENHSPTNHLPLCPQLVSNHPLSYTWVMWYDRITNSRPQFADYVASLNKLCTLRSIEDFWGVYNNIPSPSKLEKNSNYHFFKKGIQPLWEDPVNKHGGKWVLTVKNKPALLDKLWFELLLELIGEQIESSHLITGAVLSKRKKGDRIAVWTSDKKQKHGNLNICKQLIRTVARVQATDDKSMDLSKIVSKLSSDKGEMSLVYTHHFDSLKTGTSYHGETRISLKENLNFLL